MRRSTLIMALIAAASAATALCAVPSKYRSVRNDGETANAAATNATAASATETSAVPEIMPFFGNGFAEAAAVAQAAGSVSFHMDTCGPKPTLTDDGGKRNVTATISKQSADLEHDTLVIDAIMRDAASFAWGACPYEYVDFNHQPTGWRHYNLDTVQLRGPGGELLFSASLGDRGVSGFGDGPLSSGRKYKWINFSNVAAAQREAAAQAQQAASRQALFQQMIARQEKRTASIRRGFSTLFKSILILGSLLWCWIKRETILRWWYSLTPHPAKKIVDDAINSGVPIDGNLYAKVTRPVFGGALQTSVRIGQAEELTRRLRRHEAALHAAEAREVERIIREVERENALMRAYLDLVNAGIDHEIAAARVEAIMTRITD